MALTITIESDQLVPKDGKDEAYDTIVEEIKGIEEELEEKLNKFQKQFKCEIDDDFHLPSTEVRSLDSTSPIGTAHKEIRYMPSSMNMMAILNRHLGNLPGADQAHG